MTVPGYVDSDEMVWRRRWFDCTSAAARTGDVGQHVVMVRHTSSFNPDTATIHYLVTFLRPPAMQGETLIYNSMRRTPPPERRVGWDEFLLMRPGSRDGIWVQGGSRNGNLGPGMEPGSRDSIAYFAILTLFES